MNKIKKYLVVVDDILHPTSIYKNGYKFLSRCSMHSVSLSKGSYSIYCDNQLKENPSHDDIALLTQYNQSLVNNEICKVLPYDCHYASVGDYINKTLSKCNNWNSSDATV